MTNAGELLDLCAAAMMLAEQMMEASRRAVAQLVSRNGKPISDGRTISVGLIGMPPANCATYSAKASRRIAASTSVNVPAPSSARAQRRA